MRGEVGWVCEGKWVDLRGGREVGGEVGWCELEEGGEMGGCEWCGWEGGWWRRADREVVVGKEFGSE